MKQTRNQIRQTELCWLAETKEYYVKLFINGVYQKGCDYYTEDMQKARDQAKEMEKQLPPQDDFCKAAEAKAKPTKPEIPDWPIYSEDGELIGWLTLPENEQLPEILCVQDKIYLWVKVSKTVEGKEF